jgi:hypothetical protein
MSCFSYLLSFFFYKIREQEGRTGPAQRNVDPNERGVVGRKGDKKVNKVQKMYTHVCKCKNDTC